MKYLVLIACLVCFQANCQSYTVIHTIGKIYDSSTEKYLAKGMKVSEKSNLKFETDGARAAVLSSSRGRFVIQKNKNSTSTSDAIYALTSVISPVRGRLSTRSGSINNTLDFEKHFNEGPVALVGKSYRTSVSSTSYPMTENQFFYVQYQFKDETINKKLSNNEENMIIDIPSFYSIDDAAIDPEMAKNFKLYYYDATNGTSSLITDMQLVFVSDDTLGSLLKEFKEEEKSAILEIINNLYGRCSEEQFEDAIQSIR